MAKKKLKTWHAYGTVLGTKYLGTVQAATREEAEDKALEEHAGPVSLCHQCASEAEDASVESVTVEEA